MPSKPTDAKALTITLTEDGTATLTGINYQDLRSILTAASIHNYEAKQRVRKLDGMMDDVVHANNVDDAIWRRWQRALLDILSAHMAEAIRPGYSDGKPAAECAHKSYLLALKTIDQDVREAEAREAAAPPPPVDPYAEISMSLAAALRKADGALAQLDRVRQGGSL